MPTEVEEVEGELITTSDNHDSLATLNAAEIDVAIATAKRYPRSVKAFKAQALEMATLDEETAGDMFYRLERKGKNGKVSIIEGPSIRMAEIVGCCWTNLRYASRVVSVDEKFVTAQGVAFDLERNTSASVEVKRRITTKEGYRFSDDMIQVTAAAASSIALRNAIMRVVPRAYIDPIVKEAKLASVGKAETMVERRNKAVAWFAKAGVKDTDLLTYLERKGWDDVTIDDLIRLRGLATAIKDGTSTVEEALAKPDASASKAKPSELNKHLADEPAAETAKPKSRAKQKTLDDAKAPDFDVDAFEARLAECDTVDSVEALYSGLCGPAGYLQGEQATFVGDACAVKKLAIKGGV